jgi:predicted phage tail protein
VLPLLTLLWLQTLQNRKPLKLPLALLGVTKMMAPKPKPERGERTKKNKEKKKAK